MADNVTLPGTGVVVASDDVGGVEYQEVKLDGGGNGVSVPIVAGQQTMSASLPVVLASDQTGIPLASSSSTATWTSATAQDTAVTLSVGAYGAAVLAIIKTAPVTGGTVIVEFCGDGSTFETSLSSALSGAIVRLSSGILSDGVIGLNALSAGASHWIIAASAFSQIRVRLSSIVVGAGSIAVTLRGSAASAPRAMVVSDGAGSLTVDGTVHADGTTGHDAVGSATTPVAIGGYASAAAPSDVSNDTDIVRTWLLRSGAAAVQLTHNGTLLDPRAVAGDVAHDAVNSGNPVQIGFEAIAHGANPTAVAAADRTKGYANRAGIPFYIGGHPNIVTIEVATTGAATDTAIVTVAGGLKIVVTQVQVVTDNANTAFPQIRVGFGAVNTPTTTGVVLTHPGLPAGGGVSRGDGSGIIGIGADGEDLRYTCGAPTGGSLRVLASYYTVES